MIIDYITKKCPECGSDVLCDLHECDCVFGHCEGCGTDLEFDKKCKNIYKRIKHCCKKENETSLYADTSKKWYIICNKCFNFIRWEN